MLPVSTDWTMRPVAASALIASAAPGSTRPCSRTTSATDGATCARTRWKASTWVRGCGTPARASVSSAMARSVRPAIDGAAGTSTPNIWPKASW